MKTKESKRYVAVLLAMLMSFALLPFGFPFARAKADAKPVPLSDNCRALTEERFGAGDK